MSEPQPRSLHPETIAVLAGRPPAGPDAPVNPPIVLSSTYHAGGPVAYARDGNPTWSAFEEAIGALEGGRALLFASGMAATASILESLPHGATVVAPDVAYFGTREMLGSQTDGRFSVRAVDIRDTAATIAACEGADLLWLESPTNPMMGIADIAALAAGAHEAEAIVVVDNTFATPILQQPLALGADVVMHSVTKFIAGHSDVVLGVVVTRDETLWHAVEHYRARYGAIPGPMEAFLALRGVRTLPVRIERAQQSAGILAERLAAHLAVERVRYPGLPSDPGHDLAARQMRGFGAMLSFEVAGGKEAAERVVASVRVITHATSLGGVESLIERRNRWPGEERTPPGLLRFSVGCEHVDDLWADLEQALETVS